MKDTPNWVKNLLLSLISFLIIIGVLEFSSAFILRYFNRVPYNTYLIHDPILGWKLAPNIRLYIRSHAKNFEFECKINSAGFREDDQGALSPQECDAKETLSYQLAHLLSVSGMPVKILNAGVPGYGIDQFYLRLVKLGHLKKGTAVIIVIHARNDCINTCNDVDYYAYKPFPKIQQNSLIFPKVPYKNPGLESHFASPFNRLNTVFSLKTPDKPSWLDQLSLKSDLIDLLINCRHLTLSRSPTQAKEVIWEKETSEEYAQLRLQNVRNNPKSLAVRMWPEIKQFDAERQRMMAPDAARLQAFYKRLTDTLQDSLPDYHFEWGWTHRAFSEKLNALEIPFIEPQYPPDDLESMFVPLDGHTSGKAFGLIAERIVEKWKE
ncbi:hypothetical protein HYR99_09695 [Candidatus Poribacteria bacterium]|nr:hypothetical protein [Candidatus Poribacteria bacterium]